ncbi:MAG: Rubisco activation protein CbbO, partial [uncultured Thiotrichaceae bacterium]
MAIQLSDYKEELDSLSENAHDVLEANWQDAARVFSPRGLDHYLKGASALSSLGRGEDLVFSFLESAPVVAREIGEDAVSELLSSAIKMYSRTSAEVLVLLFSSSPVVAQRLNESGLFKGYLNLLNNLLAQAPRALRPMLSNIDTLLAYLTLGGLRRWATWGASAYRNDFAAQVTYFGLESDESHALMKKEQRGVLFVDVQRRLIMYLRALWGQDFFLRPTSGDFETREGYRPFIEQSFVHLPDAFDDIKQEANHGADDILISGLEIYRAAAAHCASHIKHSVYLGQYTDSDSDDPPAFSALQKVMIGLFEDARIEKIAVDEFPGLQPLWISLLSIGTENSATNSDTGILLDKIARGLADQHFICDDPLVAMARQLFFAAADRLEDERFAIELGLKLAEKFTAQGLSFNPNQDRMSNGYRDDNRYLWQNPEDEDYSDLLPGQVKQVRKYVSVMEMLNNLDVQEASDDAQEIWVLKTEFFHDDGTSLNEKEGKAPIASPVHYSEWDYQTQLE